MGGGIETQSHLEQQKSGMKYPGQVVLNDIADTSENLVVVNK